jgi:hypothetical protein
MARLSSEMCRFVVLGFLPNYVHLTAEDGIFRTYRGVRISIIEVLMSTGNSSDRIAFDGLILQIGLPVLPIDANDDPR